MTCNVIHMPCGCPYPNGARLVRLADEMLAEFGVGGREEDDDG